MIDKEFFPGLSHDPTDREAYSYDFGRLAKRTPAAVATPNSAEEISSIVRKAAKKEVRLAIRGGGHSQGGQSLTSSGLVLDMKRLNQVEVLGKELVRAQGGSQWGEIVDALRGTRRLPPVLVDTSEATVGGALSAGGLGTSSHRHGVQIGQVEQLEVVIGTGERVRCSRARNSDLFDAVRGGLGQFGVITEVWLRLRRAGERIRQYELRYRDAERFQSDFRLLVKEDRFDHLRAQIRVHEGQIVVGAGAEYDGNHDEAEALEGLGHDEVVSVRDTDEVGRAGMYPTWGFLRRRHHPWRDWFLPWDALPTLIAHPWLEPRWVPRAPFSWIGIYPIRTRAIDAPLFMRPAADLILSYSVLATLSRFERANELAARLQEIDRKLVGLGGKSYLSGLVGYGRRQWREHYGDRFETGVAWKKAFDPKRVFGWKGMPF